MVETLSEPTFKYSVNTSFLYNKERKEYTANVYRDLRVLYREIRVQGFQLYGDCMLSTIPAIISCKVKKVKNGGSTSGDNFYGSIGT